ncbi:amino acid ABC transporter permease [Pseudaquabacterium rugosum]
MAAPEAGIPARPPPRGAAADGRGRRRRWRGGLVQALLLAMVAGALAWLALQTLDNMRARGIRSGFDFLGDAAGFDIGETPIPYDALDSYARAFAVGIANTLRVALPGIVLCTLIGTLVGIGRRSPNALLRGLCGAWVEVLRNVPVLLQLLIGYLLLTEWLPDPDAPLSAFGHVFLSKGGLALPAPLWESGRLVWDLPRPGPFAVEGGMSLTPEYLALLAGLVAYTSAFVAEIVRGGIAAVPRGQTEAALALGLGRGLLLRRVVLPQALRVIIPPLGNQYLNLTKNSSLAVAIGYPDVVSIANTSINQTGRAVECIALIMAVYLCTSLGTAALMQVWNRRAAIRER